MIPYAFDIMWLWEKFSIRCHNPLNLGQKGYSLSDAKMTFTMPEQIAASQLVA